MMRRMHSRLFSLGIFCALFALFCASFFFAHAESESAPSSTASDMQTRMDERRDAMQEGMDARRAEIASSTADFKARMDAHRAELAEKLQNRIYNLLSNITGRMDAAVFRLSNIADRIESRTHKLEAQGVKGDEVYSELAKARASLERAHTILSADLGTFVWQDKPRERFVEVRGKLQEAGGDIRDAHESLLAAFVALKTAIAETGAGDGVSDAVRQDSATGTNASAN